MLNLPSHPPCPPYSTADTQHSSTPAHTYPPTHLPPLPPPRTRAPTVDPRPGTNNNPGEGRSCQPYLRFRAQTGPPGWATGAVVTAPFGVGWGLGCAIVDPELGRVQAFGSREAGVIGTWGATGLTPAATWVFSEAVVLPPGFTAFNTAVGKGVLPDGTTGYAMLIEVRGPCAVAVTADVDVTVDVTAGCDSALNVVVDMTADVAAGVTVTHPLLWM